MVNYSDFMMDISPLVCYIISGGIILRNTHFRFVWTAALLSALMAAFLAACTGPIDGTGAGILGGGRDGGNAEITIVLPQIEPGSVAEEATNAAHGGSVSAALSTQSDGPLLSVREYPPSSDMLNHIEYEVNIAFAKSRKTVKSTGGTTINTQGEVGPVTINIRATHNGRPYASGSTTGLVEPYGPNRFPVSLKKDAKGFLTVSGSISSDRPGGRLGGVTVQLMQGVLFCGTAVTTGADGSWSVPDLETGDGYYIVASKAGYVTGTGTVFSISGDKTGVNLTLVRLASVSGTISGDNPAGPLAGATVQLKDSGNNNAGTTGRTDANGAYTVSGVTHDATYTAVVSKAGYDTGTISAIAVAGTDLSGVDLTLTRKIVSVTGTVYKDNPSWMSPASGVPVMLTKDSVILGNASTDGSGVYTISGILADTGVVLSAVLPGSLYIMPPGAAFDLIADATGKDLYVFYDTWLIEDFGSASCTSFRAFDASSSASALRTYMTGLTSGKHIIYVTGTQHSFILPSSGSGAPSVNLGSGVEVSLRGSGTLTLGEGITTNYASLFKINSGASLTLRGPELKNGTTAADTGRFIDVAGGTLTIRSGSITGNNSLGGTSSVAGVYINGGVFTMWNGTISSHSSSGVQVDTGGSFTMKGGTISANTSRGPLDGSTAGGGVLVFSGGTFTMEDGTISGNQTDADPASPGGGVGIRSGGVFSKIVGTTGTIYGTGSVPDSNNCTATDGHGHAVYYDDGPLYRDTTLNPADTLSTTDTVTNWGM